MATRLKAGALNGLLMVATLAVTLALAEAAIRTFRPEPVAFMVEDRYGLPMHWPGLVTYLPQVGRKASFNSAGMRDREHTLAKAPGVYRVLLLGDSFMEGLQVGFDSSFPHLLERNLAQRIGRPVEVINAGVSGWGTDDELRYLTSYGVEWRPDLILVAMTLHNDVSDNLREEWHTLKNGALLELPRGPAPFVSYKVTQLKAYLAAHLQLYQLCRLAWRSREISQVSTDLNSHIVQLFREPTPEQIARGFKLTGLELARMRAVTDSVGGRLAIFLLPLRVQLTDSAFAEFVRSAGIPPQAMPMYKPQQVMTGIADSLRIPVIDLLPEFRRWTAAGGSPLYLEHDGHWNENGHQVAADVVAQGLSKSAGPQQ